MDGQMSTPISSNEKPKGEYQTVLPKGKKGLIFGILFVLIFLILIFGILNYFNILSLSNLWPNQLGSLPQRLNQKSQHLKTKIFCPSIKEFCQNAHDLIKDQQYVGLGYKLSSGSAIFAAFDGNVTATSSAYPVEVNGKTTQQNFKILYLDNPDLRLRAIYFFRGPREKIKTGQVFKGQQIAVSGKLIVTYDNNSLIFSLIPGYPGSNTPTILNKENFE